MIINKPNLESQHVIQAIDLNKWFIDKNQEKIHILQDICLTIQTKQSIGIIGASGSGKSTLLHLLAGLDIASSGEVFINYQQTMFAWHALNDQKKAHIRNQKLGFIYQFHHLIPELTVLENILLPSQIAQSHQLEQRSQDLVQAYALELLETLGLAKRLNHKPSQLSGGERQRTAIARSLINQPQCIFADEPTGNLDSDHAQLVFDVLLDLVAMQNASLVVVSHDLELVKRCDVIYRIEHNQIKQL